MGSLMGSELRSSGVDVSDGDSGVACIVVAIQHKAVAVKTISGFDFIENSYVIFLFEFHSFVCVICYFTAFSKNQFTYFIHCL